jgi:hypothetical protein
VETSFPDRVMIRARLRRAMVAWQSRGGLYLVDPQGNLIDRVKSTTLPVITGVNGVVISPRLDPASCRRCATRCNSCRRRPVAESPPLVTIIKPDYPSSVVLDGRPKLALVMLKPWCSVSPRSRPFRTIGPRAQKLKSVDLRSSTPYAVYTGA